MNSAASRLTARWFGASSASSASPTGLERSLRAAWWTAGGGLIALAVASASTVQRPMEVLAWVESVFGPAFTLPYLALLLVGVHAIAQLRRAPRSAYYRELGQQAASGVATLALTFTLLGISMGIGGLAEAELTPEHVDEVIGVLTQQFSMAFMTTVIGLPTAALLRAATALVASRGAEMKERAEQEQGA